MEKAQVMAIFNSQEIDASETQLQNIDNQHSNNLSDLYREFEFFQTPIQKIETEPVLALEEFADNLSDVGKKDIFLSSLDHAKLKYCRFGFRIAKAGFKKLLRKTGVLEKIKPQESFSNDILSETSSMTLIS